MTINYKLFGLLLVLTYPQIGCAGADYNITADGAKYPMSFSRGLPDETGKTLIVGRGLDASGVLDIDETKWGFFYGAIGGTFDISNEVNRQVQAQGGAGVVELKLQTTRCALNYLWPFIFLPFWPGCIDVKVTGEVVKVSPTAPPVATPPPVVPPAPAAPAKASEEVATAHRERTGKEGANQ